MVENTTATVSKYTADVTERTQGSLSNERSYKAYFEDKSQNVTQEEAGSSLRYDAIMIIQAWRITTDGAINKEEDTVLIGLNSNYYQIVGVNAVKNSYSSPVAHYEYELKLDKRNKVRS